MQLATKTGGLATSLPVFAGFETSLAKPFRAEFTTVLSPKKIGICTLAGLTQTGYSSRLRFLLGSFLALIWCIIIGKLCIECILARQKPENGVTNMVKGFADPSSACVLKGVPRASPRLR